ncbi:MAG: hypothetical protein WA885_14715 [Phormidesmis sp.]
MTIQTRTIARHRANPIEMANQGQYLKIFVIFFILFALLTKVEPTGWNDQSRLAQVQSLVEHGSFIIDDSKFSITGDKYFFNNHFYSDKPPILALYAAPVYFVLKQLGFTLTEHTRSTYYLLTLLSIGVLSALGLTVFKKILKDFFNASDEWADITTFVTGAGTLILPYSLIFNNHVPSGVLILLGFYFFLNFKKNSGLKNAAFSGLFFSLVGGIDITCFLFIPFMLILFFRKSLQAGLTFGLSCLPAIALYLFLNLYTSGSLIPPAMNASLWDYPGSKFGSETLSGLANHDGAADVWFYAYHMLLGNRGLISHTPILLLSIIGILMLYSMLYEGNQKFRYRSAYSYMLLASLLYTASYVFRTTNYSGWAFGVRWFASLMLIWCLPMTALEPKVRSSSTLRRLFLGIACLSIFISIAGAYQPISPLAGTDLQEQLSPTNTIFVNIKLILDDFVTMFEMTSPIKEAALRIARLGVSTFVIYFLLYKFSKNLSKSIRLDRFID